MSVVVQEDINYEVIGEPGPFVVYTVDEDGSVTGNLGYYITVDEALKVAHDASDNVRDDVNFPQTPDTSETAPSEEGQ